jgi:hypothetical protein
MAKTVAGIATFERLSSSTAKSPYLQRSDRGQPWSQRKQRRGQLFRDQHGRRYFAETELLTGHPTGMIEPRFTAPLMPPIEYIRLSDDPERPYDIEIDYDRWIAEREEYHDEWVKQCRIASRKLHGQKHEPNATEFSAEVLDIVGDEPPSAEPVRAAQAGNPWILGLAKTPDRRLVQYFEEKASVRAARARAIDYSTLEALEETTDPEATGGKRVAPRKRTDPRRNHHKKSEQASASRATATRDDD